MSNPNFYGTVADTRRRILNNVVLYDGEPYKVLAVTDHKPDGIYRAYLEPQRDFTPDEVLTGGSKWVGYLPAYDYSHDYEQLGEKMDEWMKNNPTAPVLRKKVNSPAFKKFRPFPLGMVNLNGDVYYVCRKPLRRGDQGLVEDGISCHKHDLTVMRGNRKPKKTFGLNYQVPLRSDAFRNCVLGNYPSANECLEALCDNEIANTGAAFSRDFAILRGPMRSLYIAYKKDVIGLLLDTSFDRLYLDSEFEHLKEVVEEACIFKEIVVK